MCWLHLRGAAVQELKFHEVTPLSEDNAEQRRHYLQGASMLVLPQLPNLQYLSISGANDPNTFMIPERHLPIIQLLPCLKSLRLALDSDGTWNEHTLDPLKHLRALTSLDLCVRGTKGPLWLSPSLCHLTELQELRLQCEDSVVVDESQSEMVNIVSRLTTLRMLLLDGMLLDVPAQLGALARLTRLELWNLPELDQPFTIPPSFSLCTNLQHLCLQGPPIVDDEAWQHVCKSLILLTSLTALTITEVELSEVLPSSWSLPSGLTSFVLSDCRTKTLPSAVCSLPRLKNLKISDLRYRHGTAVGLTALPAGPYLDHLETLYINILWLRLETLAGAMRLQALHIAGIGDAHSSWTRNALENVLPKGCKITLS